MSTYGSGTYGDPLGTYGDLDGSNAPPAVNATSAPTVTAGRTSAPTVTAGFRSLATVAAGATSSATVSD